MMLCAFDEGAWTSCGWLHRCDSAPPHRLVRHKLFTQRNQLRAIIMSKEEEATNGSEKVEGIRLKRSEKLLLVMNTTKGAV